MHGLNIAGWTKPDGKTPVGSYWTVVRGNAAGQTLRAVYEVPKREGFRVGDLLIGGIPIDHPGQIADHITMTLTLQVFTPPGRKPSPALTGRYTAFRSQKNHAYLILGYAGHPPPAGDEAVETGVGITQALPATGQVDTGAPPPGTAPVIGDATHDAAASPSAELSRIGRRTFLVSHETKERS
jgi:hypothetical protein